VTSFSERLIGSSGYAAPGFASRYDSARPRTPEALLDVLTTLAPASPPALVVDLGSGTGLSTRAWSARANRVVGVEPNPAMVALARAVPTTPNVEYVEGFAQQTALDDGCADIVTCSQSFHWMEPEPTLAEVQRILRPGGIFAAYDYDVPPVVGWEIDAAFAEFGEAHRLARKRRGEPPGAMRYPKSGHLERIRASGRFRRARELVLQGREEGGADRLVDLALSLGPVVESDPDVAATLRRLHDVARAELGEASAPWYLGYRVRVALR
jgi:ubiquinone/menaquinone biosynthesis C-methylase UbiE